MLTKVTAALFAIVVMTALVPPAVGGNIVAKSFTVPLSGTFFDAATNEKVDLSGFLQFSILSTTTSTGTIFTTAVTVLPGYTAVGETSQTQYAVDGATVMTNRFPGALPSRLTPQLNLAVFPALDAGLTEYAIVDVLLLIAGSIAESVTASIGCTIAGAIC
jgi:hypothetical protein